MNGDLLLDRVVIITGAGSGLGRSMALALAGVGCSIAAVDISVDRLGQLAKEAEKLAGEILPICLDISEAENCVSIVEETIKTFKFGIFILRRFTALINISRPL